MKILSKKRRLKSLTDYKKRKRLLESEKPRIIIRKSNRYILIQYVESKTAQDKVKYFISSKELLKKGWPKEKEGGLKNLAACYLTGFMFGKKIAKENEAILDMGLIRSTKGSRIYSALKGLVDSGFKIKHNAEMFPKEDRIINENTKSFFDKVKTKITQEK